MARKRATKALTHKTNWGLNDTVLPEDFNRIEGNIKQNEANQNTANSNHTALAARVSKTESDISKNKTDISTANINHTALANRVTTAEGNITKNKNDIATASSNHTALAGRVTTAENNINTANSNHTALATRVSKTESDISKNKADISTANNNHTALANRVTTAEGNITNLNTKVNKLNLGVRNLAKNTSIEITSGRRTDIPIVEDEIKKLLGEEITVSVDIDIVSAVSSTNNGRVGTEFSITYSDNSIQYIGAWEFFTTTSKTVKKRIATTHRIKNMDIKTISLLGIYIQNITSGNTKIGFPKVGKGNMITDWTPAVEDIQDQITNNKNDIATANTNHNNLVKEYNKTKEQANNWDSFKKNGGTVTTKVAVTNGSNTTEYKAEGIYSDREAFNLKAGAGDNGLLLNQSGLNPNGTMNLGSASRSWENIYLAGRSIASNGYTKLPNGLTCQWVTKNFTLSNGEAIVEGPLPIEFKKLVLFKTGNIDLIDSSRRYINRFNINVGMVNNGYFNALVKNIESFTGTSGTLTLYFVGE